MEINVLALNVGNSRLAIAAFVAGHAWFYKLRKSFADII